MTPLIALTLLGCSRDVVPPADSSPDSGSPSTSETTSTETTRPSKTSTTPSGWVVLPADCDPGQPAAAGALTLIGEDQHTQYERDEWFMELVDLEYDARTRRVYGAGQGGMMVFDAADPTAPALLGSYPVANGRYYRVELTDTDRVYVSHRQTGLEVLDVSDPTKIESAGRVQDSGLEGMALAGDHLYVTDLFGTLRTFDVSDPATPVEIARTEGLSTPWDIAIDGAVAYIADSGLGVVPVDLSQPDQPVLGEPVAVGGVQDIALADGAIYAAAGGVGVVTLDRSDPLAPVVASTLSYAGSVQSVATDGALLWAVDQEDVIAIDISSPLAPVPLGTSLTPEFAMHVAAAEGVGWVGDWSRLQAWTADTDTPLPDLELSVSTLLLDDAGDTVTLDLRNTGAAALTLSGATTGDDRVEVTASAMSIAPGDAGQIQVVFSGGEDLDTTLCLASDDPDTPATTVELHSGGGGKHAMLGEPAPDFALSDLDGNLYQLSEQLGKVVVLVYFATW